MTRIYLVRHAEAEGNAYRRIHGQYDSRLTENGLRQVEALEKRFADVHIDACYASDLNRTCVTARSIYVPKHLELHRDTRFRETHLGRWEDVPFGYLYRFETESMSLFSHHPDQWSVEGSEHFEDYVNRFFTGMQEAVDANPSKTIAIFSHGSMLRAVQYVLLGNQWPPYCDNTAVSCLEYEDGKYSFVFLNDTSHLTPEISTYVRQSWWRKLGDKLDFNMWFEQEGELDHCVLRDRRVGKVQTSLGSGSAACIDLLEIVPEHRGKGLGAQLLGCAVSKARRAGKTALRIALDKTDTEAIAYAKRYTFLPVSETNTTLTLEKDIRVPQL